MSNQSFLFHALTLYEKRCITGDQFALLAQIEQCDLVGKGTILTATTFASWSKRKTADVQMDLQVLKNLGVLQAKKENRRTRLKIDFNKFKSPGRGNVR